MDRITRDCAIVVRLSRIERARWNRAAATHGFPVAELVRTAVRDRILALSKLPEVRAEGGR